VQCSRPSCKAFADVTHIKSASLIRVRKVLSPVIDRYQRMELLSLRDHLENSDSVHGFAGSEGCVRFHSAGFVRQACWVAFDRWVEFEGAFGVLEDQSVAAGVGNPPNIVHQASSQRFDAADRYPSVFQAGFEGKVWIARLQ
jgi:hypothetical protein